MLQAHYTLVDFVATWVSKAMPGDDAAAPDWVIPVQLAAQPIWGRTREFILKGQSVIGFD